MKPSIKTKLVTFFAIAALMAGVVMAHGDKKHVAGTVKEVNADSVVVRTTDGKSVKIKLVAATIYVARSGNENRPAKPSELSVGDRVVIHATPRGESLEANQVTFAPSSSFAAPAKPKG